MSQPASPVEIAASRSAFVTVVAWIFIVLAGFATLISILQNVMIAFMFPAVEMDAALEQMAADERTPWLAEFMFRHVRLIFFAFFLVCGAALASAVGLLVRKDWARRLFIGLMIFGIIWNLAGLVFVAIFMFSMPIPADAPADFRDQFDVMAKMILGFNFVIGIAFAVLFGWIVKRLMSPAIKAEFS